MKVRIAEVNKDAEKLIPPAEPDGSRIGVNHADAYVKAINVTLDDGTKVSCKRRGLSVSLAIGDKKGEGLMRRIEHGPDVQNILQHALKEAAQAAGAEFIVEDDVIYLDIQAT